MATKAEITALVNANLASGSSITAAEHRAVLTGANSILEGVYSDVVTDTHILENVTTANGNFAYNIAISKVGRHITISGNFDCINTQSANATIFTLSDTDLVGLDATATYGFARNDQGEMIRVYVLGNTFKSANTVIAFENNFFSITYLAKN